MKIFLPVICQNGHKAIASYRWDAARMEFIFESVPANQQCACPKGDIGQGYKAAEMPYIESVEQLERDAKFRQLYEELANEYCKENTELYIAIAPLLGLKPFYGKYNKQQVIWAASQEEANSLPAGANIYRFVKKKVSGKEIT